MSEYLTPLKSGTNLFSTITPSPAVSKPKYNFNTSDTKSPSIRKSNILKNKAVDIKKKDLSSYFDNLSLNYKENLTTLPDKLKLRTIKFSFLVSICFYNLFSPYTGIWELIVNYLAFFGLYIMRPERGTKFREVLNLITVGSFSYFFSKLIAFYLSKGNIAKILLAESLHLFINTANYVDSITTMGIIFQFLIQNLNLFVILPDGKIKSLMFLIQVVSFLLAFITKTDSKDLYFKNPDCNVDLGDAYVLIRKRKVITEIMTRILEEKKFQILLELLDLETVAKNTKVTNYTKETIDITTVFDFLQSHTTPVPKDEKPYKYNYEITISQVIWGNEPVFSITIYGKKIKQKRHPGVHKPNVIKFDEDELDSDISEEDGHLVSPKKLSRGESQAEFFRSPTIYYKEKEYIQMTRSIDNIDFEAKKEPSEEDKLKKEEKKIDKSTLHWNYEGEIDQRYEDGEKYMELLKKLYKEDKKRIRAHVLISILNVYGKANAEVQKAYEQFLKESHSLQYKGKLLDLNYIESERLFKFKWLTGKLEDVFNGLKSKLEKLLQDIKMSKTSEKTIYAEATFLPPQKE